MAAMLDDRNLTAHTHREILAEAIAANIRAHHAACLIAQTPAIAGVAELACGCSG